MVLTFEARFRFAGVFGRDGERVLAGACRGGVGGGGVGDIMSGGSVLNQ